MKYRVCFCLVLAGTLAVYGQRAGGGRTGGGNTGNTNPVGNVPSNPSPIPNPNTNTPNRTNMPGTMTPEMPRPIFLSGRVMLDDGTPPPEPIAIKRVCNAREHTETYTDSKGRFSFELGKEMGVMADASEQTIGPGFGRQGQQDMGNMSPTQRPAMAGGMERSLMGCELRAYLPGYTSNAVNLAFHRSLDNPDVGTIILHRIAGVQGDTISATSAMAPKDARKAFEKAQAALKKNKVADAKKDLEKSVTIYPKYAAAWYELGRVRLSEGDTAGAKKAFEQSLAADSRYVRPYEHLAEMAAQDAKWEEVKADTDRLLSLDSVDYPGAWYLNAVSNFQSHKLDAAEKSAREGLKVDSTHRVPRLTYLLGVVLANQGKYEEAASAMKQYLALVPGASDGEKVRQQLAEVEKQLTAAKAPATPPTAQQ